jgi:hypothetical protein
MDPSRPADGPPARRGRRLLLLLGLSVVTAAALWAAHGCQRRRPVPPPDVPSAEPAQPYLNARPGVGYEGSARCAECHETEAATYAEHPMGRSVSPAGEALPGQHEAAPSFEAAGLRYAVEQRPDGVFHRESADGSDGRAAAEVVVPVAFAVGSGRHGQSFLVNRDGYLFMSPISWYTRERAWALSPNYEKSNEHFSRRIAEGCLFCHANEARTEPDTVNHYRPAVRLEPIGCERCHGPGELHVAARRRGEAPAGADLTIVNPGRLEPPLREAVCQQCHLQGEARIVHRGRLLYNYRPGLPLDEVVSVYVYPPDEVDTRKAVSHVEQMVLSRCYRGSGGKLGCISCHDPHVLPSARQRVAWFRGRCLACHQDTSCTLPPEERRRQDPEDGCITCHMPRGDTSNVAHTAITDHRIVRRPAAAAPGDGPADLALVPFHGGPFGGGDAGGQRDLGLALCQMLDRPLPEAQGGRLARQACGLLGPAVASAPDDVPAQEKLGLALWKDKRPREALDVLEKALRQAPRRELALEKAALVSVELGDYERSTGYWQRLLAVNPHSWQSHGFFGQTLAFRKQWPAAADECRAALRLDPFQVPTRMLLIDCLVHMGEEKQARAEFDTLLALRPPDLDRLRRWFDELTRPEPQR